jgi:protease-4
MRSIPITSRDTQPNELARKSPAGSGLLPLGLLVLLAPALSGCVIIPIGDLLKGPSIEEQTLVRGEGLFAKRKVALVDLSGVITGEDNTSVFSTRENTVSEVKARLELARNDGDVRAVVLRISSPGGEVTASDIIHREVVRFREETGKPVVACILDQGASGAYYVASAADAIIAHPTSIIGSIGVVLHDFDLSGLLAKIGVAIEPVKSSDKKDLLSLFRAQTPEERDILQKLVNDMYERFIEVVERGRPDLDHADVVELADGRVVSGSEAVRLKLADSTGYLEDAIAEASRRAGIERPTVIRYTRRAQSGANIYTQLASRQPAAGEIHISLRPESWMMPRLLYLWRPGR